MGKKLFTLLLLVFSCSFAYAQTYTVERIVDGDTLKLTSGDRIRMIGIDTPESRDNAKAERDSKRSGQDIKTIIKMGNEAKNFLKSLGLEGKEVYLEFDVQQRDKYGRLLAYVFVDTGIKRGDPLDFKFNSDYYFDYFNNRWMHFINASIVKAGYAQPMTIPPNVKYADLFRKLYKNAREKKRGLWTDENKD